jgi:hypothetical protein
MLAPFTGFLLVKMADQSSFESDFFLLGRRSLVLTLDNLRKQDVIVFDRCCMCKRNEESMDHLFLYCEVAFASWNAIFSRFGLSWVMPSWVVDLFACLLVDRWTLRVLSCGRWCPLTFCGAYGGKKMIKISRSERGRWRSSSPFILFLLGCICRSLGD